MAKVLQLIETQGPGGAEKLLITLAQHSGRNHSQVVGLLSEGWLSERLSALKCDVSIIPSGSSIDVKLLWNLVKIIKKHRVDIVHSHLLDMNFYSSIAAALARVAHVATEHGDIHHLSKRRDFKTVIKARTISLLSDRIVFFSKFTQAKFLEVAKVSQDKSMVIHNALDLGEYQKSNRNGMRKTDLGIGDQDHLIGNVANLYPVKGQIYLLRAAKIVVEEMPNVKFVIVGRGGLEDLLKREACAMGVKANVHFLGYREDIKELLEIMDIFVLPSISEGLPMSLLEAMASERPVVATKVGGIPEVISDGESGFLIPPPECGRAGL